jgi:hypothetical protein
MNLTIEFLFYLGAVVCFALAAFGTRFATRVGLVPLGLALFTFPTMWKTGVAVL